MADNEKQELKPSNSASTLTRSRPSTPSEQESSDNEKNISLSIIGKIMSRAVPNGSKLSDEVILTMQLCVSRFICHITNGAIGKCNKEGRRTITEDDILYSMKQLHFAKYEEHLSLYLHRYREALGKESTIQRATNIGQNVKTFGRGSSTQPFVGLESLTQPVDIDCKKKQSVGQGFYAQQITSQKMQAPNIDGQILQAPHIDDQNGQIDEPQLLFRKFNNIDIQDLS